MVAAFTHRSSRLSWGLRFRGTSLLGSRRWHQVCCLEAPAMTLRRKYPSFAQECLMTFLHFLFNFCFPKRKNGFVFSLCRFLGVVKVMLVLLRTIFVHACRSWPFVLPEHDDQLSRCLFSTLLVRRGIRFGAQSWRLWNREKVSRQWPKTCSEVWESPLVGRAGRKWCWALAVNNWLLWMTVMVPCRFGRRWTG